MDFFMESGRVDLTSVILASSSEIFQTIEPKERQASSSLQELFSLLVPSMPLLVSFLITSIFLLVAVFLLALTIRKRFNSQVQPIRTTIYRRKPKTTFGFSVVKQLRSYMRSYMRSYKLLRRSRVFRVLLITYVLFAFLVQIMLSMNIKTEKIIVDTTDLIHSEESLRNTKRRPCFPGMSFSIDP